MAVVVPEVGLGCANLLHTELPEFIDVAEGAGFHRITVRPYAFAQARDAGWTEDALQRRLDDAGIEVTMIDALITALPGRPLSADLDPELRARLPIDVTDPPDEATCFRAATALGASIVNVTHYLGQPLPLDAMAGALAGVCRRAAPLGLRICLEFFPDSGLPDITFAQSVIEACGESNASLLLDLFHLDRSGGTVEDIRRLPAPRSQEFSSATGEGRHPGHRTCPSEVGGFRGTASSRCVSWWRQRWKTARRLLSTLRSSTRSCRSCPQIRRQPVWRPLPADGAPQ